MGKLFSKLFVGGDLSGIQKFLYNISSSKAAVSLIGRSAYLNDFMKEACDGLEVVAKGCGVATKRLYCSGGKFYFLTENTKGVVSAIADFSNNQKKKLWDEHKGILGFSISCVPYNEISETQFEVEGCEPTEPGILWKKANADFARQKNQKFKNLLIDDFDKFFEPIPVGGTPKICDVTGIESSLCYSYEGLTVLPSVKEQIEKGKVLSKDRNFRNFEDYADDTYLGVLRMDVDGLGSRFIKGFKTLDDYQTFSDRLVNFFEKEVLNIQREAEFFNDINIIYAGGDDLFAVGRWDKVIDFAERIHTETVERFGADGLTISGGVVIVKNKYPIAKAAIQAGEAEDAAKHANGGAKNAFCMFGRVVSWKDEFAFVKEYKEEFVELITSSNPPLSKGLLHKIMLYASMAERNKARRIEGKSEDFSYVWHLPYYLTRYMKDKNEKVQALCHRLRDSDFIKDARRLQLIALGARWAELVLKEKV